MSILSVGPHRGIKIIWDTQLPLLGEFQALLSGRLCGFPKNSYKKKKVDSVGLLSAKFYSAVYVHVLNWPKLF